MGKKVKKVKNKNKNKINQILTKRKAKIIHNLKIKKT